ncbi:MAG: GNAT family N-acetyltransferase; N-acetyltransferase, partial [Bacteroidota bacterium]
MKSIITTRRLNLRYWVDSDLTPLIEMNQDEDVMRYFPSIMSEDESISFYERINKHFS